MKEATKSYRSINTILQYYGVNHSDYWHIDYRVFNKNEWKELYFWDLRDKYLKFTGVRDENNIPLYLGVDKNYYYSVIFLGHYALGAYQYYKINNCLSAKREFLNICDWLVLSQETYKCCSGVWINKYPMPTFRLDSDWASGLSQAKGISCLVRAYSLTGDEKYISAAIKATNSFDILVEHGGVKTEHGDFICIEEYTTIGSSNVLNGFIFGVWALYDLTSILDCHSVNTVNNLVSLRNKYIVSLAENLHRWDCGGWSLYDIWNKHRNVASFFYHDLHVKQLYILNELTGCQIFYDMAKKWEKNKKNKVNCTVALCKKLFFRIKNRN